MSLFQTNAASFKIGNVTIYSASSLPDDSVGKIGDVFITTTNPNIYIKNQNNEWAFLNYPIGYAGSRGFTGQQGPTGEGLDLQGTLTDVNDLPVSGDAGDGYIIGSDLYVWDGSEWQNVGQFVGFTGSRGFTGSIGFTGSQGVVGFTGQQGGVGFTGSQGDIGFTGSQGVVGFTGQQGGVGFTGSQGDIGFTGSRGFTGQSGTLQNVTDNGNTTTNPITVGGMTTPNVDLTLDSLADENITGRIKWDTNEETISLGIGDDYLLLGQQTVYHVENNTGQTITKGTLVMAVGTLGSSGKILIAPAVSDGSVESKMILGIVKQDIPTGEQGYVIHFGKLRKLDTSGFSEGDILYADPLTNGGLTTTIPEAPNLKLVVAIVIVSHAQVGEIFIRPTYGSNLSNDELVQISNLQNGQVIAYNQSSGRFENVDPSELDTGATSQFVATGGVSATLTTSLQSYLTAPSSTIYKIESLHFQNITDTEETVSVFIAESVGQTVQIGYNIPLPPGAAIELNYNTTVIKNGDAIQMQASANSSISASISYSIDSENIWVGNGFKLTNTNEFIMYTSSATNGSELRSFKITNISIADVTIRAYTKDASNVIQSYYCYDTVIPANQTLELFTKAKHLPSGHSVRIITDTADVIDAYISGLDIN